MQSKTYQMFNQVINESTQEIQEELKITKNELDCFKMECAELQRENEELKSTLNMYKMVPEVESLLTEENFKTMLPLFKLKSNNFSISGMHLADVPDWFKYLFHFYEDREKLFNLMDLFGVKYPTWAKNYKMPYDYSEEELGLFIKHIGDHYVCNSCIFKENTSFFWGTVKRHHGDTRGILNNGQYTEIPWQLTLSNPLWATDNLFSKILEVIKSKKSNSEYFFAIQTYIQITDAQAIEMMKLLPKNNLDDIHIEFLKNNKKLIKECPYFVENFKHNINDIPSSIFYYLNYPLENQKEYIRNLKDFEFRMKLIKRMDISDEEKIKFSMEFLGDVF